MIVIKFGGSLLSNPNNIRKIFKEIENLKQDFLVVPGGGEFADLVLKYYKTHNLKLKISNDACILAMDIVGLILSNFTKIKPSYELKKRVIFLPSQFLFNSNVKASNKTTSDSIAVEIAKKVDAEFLVLLKSVDGIKSGKKFVREINVGDLEKIKQDVVDENFPKFLKKFKKEAYIINGNFPERIKLINLLSNKQIEDKEKENLKNIIYTKIYL